MARKKNQTRKDIQEAKMVLTDLMRDHLAGIAQSMVDQLMSKFNRGTDAQRFDAVKNLNPSGIAKYRQALLAAYAVIANDAIDGARAEFPPSMRKQLSERVKLAEFEDLPPAVRKRLQGQVDAVIGKQEADLRAAINFQWQHSVDSTDSASVLQDDIESNLEDYLTGSAIEAGASTTAASIINESRNAYFFDDDVLEQVDAFEFVNGDPVTEICQDLAGTIFAKDDPEMNRYMPPLHFNCKSYIVPILAGDLGNRQIERLKPSSKKLEDQIQFSECPGCGQHHEPKST